MYTFVKSAKHFLSSGLRDNRVGNYLNTVGIGISPIQPYCYGSRTFTAGGESHPALKIFSQTIVCNNYYMPQG